jgi:hypothetical protein
LQPADPDGPNSPAGRLEGLAGEAAHPDFFWIGTGRKAA